MLSNERGNEHFLKLAFTIIVYSSIWLTLKWLHIIINYIIKYTHMYQCPCAAK